jgi:hypothetical protein
MCLKRVLWGKAACATRTVSVGMASRGWKGRDILLFECMLEEPQEY